MAGDCHLAVLTYFKCQSQGILAHQQFWGSFKRVDVIPARPALADRPWWVGRVRVAGSCVVP